MKDLNCPRLEETKDTQQPNEMWDVGLEPGTEKGYYLDNWLNLKMIYRLLNSILSRLIFWF